MVETNISSSLLMYCQLLIRPLPSPLLPSFAGCSGSQIFRSQQKELKNCMSSNRARIYYEASRKKRSKQKTKSKNHTGLNEDHINTSYKPLHQEKLTSTVRSAKENYTEEGGTGNVGWRIVNQGGHQTLTQHTAITSGT